MNSILGITFFFNFQDRQSFVLTVFWSQQYLECFCAQERAGKFKNTKWYDLQLNGSKSEQVYIPADIKTAKLFKSRYPINVASLNVPEAVSSIL